MAEINSSQLAKIAGLNRQAVYNAIRRGKIISNTAGKVDTQNKKNIEWMRQHGISENDVIQFLNEIQNKQQKKQKIKAKSNPMSKIREKIEKKEINIDPEIIQKTEQYFTPESKNKTDDELLFEDISGLPAKMMKLNLFQLVIRYGGPMQLSAYSLILQRIMSASKIDQETRMKRLELIEKDFIISRVMLYIETLSKMLFDHADSFPIKVISLVRSEIDMVEIEIKKSMREYYSILIKDTKEKIKDELENLKKKYEKPSDSNN
jgi:hypothetical protein